MARCISGEVRADTEAQGMMTKPQDPEYGGSEWSEQFKSAIREAVTEAVREHQRRGYPVYFADDEDFLCVIMPDGHERRLKDIEIKDLTR